MDVLASETQTSISWGHDRLSCVLVIGPDAPVALVGFTDRTDALITADAVDKLARAQPLVELFATGSGHRRAASRIVNSADGARLRYVSHETEVADDWSVLRVRQVDPETGLEVTAVLRSPLDVAAVTFALEVHAAGENRVVLESLAVALNFANGESGDADRLDLVSATNDWLAEGRWTRTPLRSAGLPQLNLAAHASDPKSAISQVSNGSWSTEHGMPVGGLVDTISGRALAWQIEANGGWRWEVGESRSGTYLALSGPNARDHEWVRDLGPGESFATVPVTVAVGDADFESAIAALTLYRRALRRDHPDNTRLPVVFNDYMNTLMGDPTTAKLLPLIATASQVGAEVFVIDAGWYDESGDWWDSVGEWTPSTTRFPGGISKVIDSITSAGMIPGLWLEPEVVGVRSPLADQLPDDAFLQRDGIRVREHDRYHLDLRSPDARAHLDSVIDRLVADFGVGYFKLDYNINAGPGTDVLSDSMGDGLLGHNRAHLAWLDGVLDRHPALILENCASGAMRMDFGILSRLQLQSTSDQQDPILYPPIAASAPLAMLPEQAANWAYPQPGMSAEDASFTLSTAMLGRFYLSGYLNQMSPTERALVATAVAVHKSLREDIRTSMPLWPLGFPGWTNPWIALGLRAGERCHLTLWRLDGGSPGISIPLPHLAGRDVQIEPVFPLELEPWSFKWDAHAGVLQVDAGPVGSTARTVTITELSA
jgi:alpha-galactosidase